MNQDFSQLLGANVEPTANHLSLLAEMGFSDGPAALQRILALDSRSNGASATRACLRRLLIGLWESPAPDAAHGGHHE